MINDSKDYSFKYSYNPGIYHALKFIKSWQYECMEGEPMESSMLYVTFRKIISIIITSAIAKIPPAEFWKTYEKAVWG